MDLLRVIVFSLLFGLKGEKLHLPIPLGSFVPAVSFWVDEILRTSTQTSNNNLTTVLSQFHNAFTDTFPGFSDPFPVGLLFWHWHRVPRLTMTLTQSREWLRFPWRTLLLPLRRRHYCHRERLLRPELVGESLWCAIASGLQPPRRLWWNTRRVDCGEIPKSWENDYFYAK